MDGGNNEARIAYIRSLCQLARAEGVAHLRDGEIVIALGPPPRSEQAKAVEADIKSTDPKIAALRELSRKQFGRVLPDSQLLALEGVL